MTNTTEITIKRDWKTIRIVRRNGEDNITAHMRDGMEMVQVSAADYIAEITALADKAQAIAEQWPGRSTPNVRCLSIEADGSFKAWTAYMGTHGPSNTPVGPVATAWIAEQLKAGGLIPEVR